MTFPSIRPLIFAPLLVGALLMSFAVQAADRDRVAAFLKVTGFDVALDSIALSAESAPMMLGIEPGEFDAEWARISKDVFDTQVMRGFALDILERGLSDEALDHAAAFYATDLGQRLVEVENDSHMADDDLKQETGQGLVAKMELADDPRLDLLARMNSAIGGLDTTVQALQEIQFRTLIAASQAGVITLQIDPEELRAILAAAAPEMRDDLRDSALAGAAYTYQAFSDADIEAYAEALEKPLMQEVYELLNAVQYEITANRFEELARQLSGVAGAKDI